MSDSVLDEEKEDDEKKIVMVLPNPKIPAASSNPALGRDFFALFGFTDNRQKKRLIFFRHADNLMTKRKLTFWRKTDDWENS